MGPFTAPGSGLPSAFASISKRSESSQAGPPSIDARIGPGLLVPSANRRYDLRINSIIVEQCTTSRPPIMPPPLVPTIAFEAHGFMEATSNVRGWAQAVGSTRARAAVAAIIGRFVAEAFIVA